MKNFSQPMKKFLFTLLRVVLLVSGCTPSGSTPVYVTKTGTHYHRDDCRYLTDSKIEISLKLARISYDPCEVCTPPQ